MSHVNEGGLHAYLDGALDEYPTCDAEAIRSHLDQCAECATRLVEARRIRSDATAMLGLAAPDVEIPNLEELRAYVRSTRTERPSRGGRMYRMGWAASVVLALGVGWMMRGGQLQQLQAPARSEVGTVAPLPVASGQAASSEVSTPVGTSLRAEEGLSAGAASDAPVERDADLAGSLGAGSPASSTVAVAEPKTASGLGDILSPVMAKATVPDDLEEAAAASEDTDRIFSDLSDWQVTPVEFVAKLPIAGDLPDALLAQGLAEVSPLPVAEREAQPDDAQDDRRRAESLVPVTSAFGARSGSAARSERSEGNDEGDEPPLFVEGHEVLSVTNMGEGTIPLGVHVMQRLEGGEILDLFHLEKDVDPAIVPTPDDGRNEVRVETAPGWIVIQGRRSQAELRVLLTSFLPDGGG